MPTVPRPPPMKHKRTYHTQRKANKTISGNCYRPVLLCWARLSNQSGLLHLLAWYHPHKTQHHYIPNHYSCTTWILQDCYPRYHLIRWRNTIYFHQIQSIVTTMGLSAQDIITVPPPNQRKNWIYSQMDEENHLDSVEWSLFGPWQILLCTPSVQKHTL